MFQITGRTEGTCFLCEETDVVTLNKNGQPISLCRKHLWEALKNGKKLGTKAPNAISEASGK